MIGRRGRALVATLLLVMAVPAVAPAPPAPPRERPPRPIPRSAPASPRERSPHPTPGRSVTAPPSTPQERPPRRIPPLTIPEPRDEPPREPRPERGPPLLEPTLSEGGPSTVEDRPGPEVTPLSDERVRALLARLPEREEGTEPSALGDPRAAEVAPTPVLAPDPGGLSVVSVLPSGETELAPHVTVVFSRPMVPLGRDGEPVDGPPPARLSPEPPGAWRWLDVRTLRFEADGGRLPGATAFRLQVPADATSVDGVALGTPHEASFRTAGPRAVGGFPNDVGDPDRNLAPRVPDILLVFDQRVEPGAVLAAARLTVEGEARPLERVVLEELDTRRPGMAQAARQAGDGLWVALRPGAPLPAGSEPVLRLDGSLPSAEGALPAGRAQVLRFRVREAMEVAGTSCGGDELPCTPRGYLRLRFTNPLEPDQPVAGLVDVRPEVEGLRVVRGSREIDLLGDFRPHTAYTVEVGGELRDRFGQRLENGVELDVRFGAASPWVRIPGAPFVVLDPASEGRMELPVRAVEGVDVGLYRVEPGDWPGYAEGLRAFGSGHGGLWTPPGDPVARWTLESGDGGRGYSRLPLDLSEALRETGGHALLMARGRMPSADAPAADTAVAGPTGRARVRRRALQATAWIQSTSFAVGAVWDPGEVVGWAVSLEDGRPLQGVELHLPRAGRSVRTDAAGLARLAPGEGRDSLLIGRHRGEVALLPSRVAGQGGAGWSGDPTHPAPLWFTLTDRGLYRPGEVLEGHGWIRELAGEPRRDLSLPVRTDSVRYRIVAGRSRTVAEGVASVSPTGTFHVVERLPAELRSGPGTIRLTAVAGGEEAGGWTTATRFRIEEFRRAEYEVAVDLPPGPHVAGGTVEAGVRARYYDGAGLRGSEVVWSVATSVATWTAPGWQGWRFGPDPAWAYRDLVPWRERLEARTDVNGEHVLRIGTGTPSRPFPASLSVTGRVRDVNRQVGSGRAATVIHPAARVAGLRSDRRWVRVGEELTAAAVAVDLDGRVDPDLAPRVRAFLEPDSSRPGSGDIDEPVPVRCGSGPDEEVADQIVAPLRCVIRPRSAGTYRIEAEVRDDEGRRSVSQIRTRVHGSTSRWIGSDDRQGFEVEPDRESYVPGDTARLLLSVPFHPLDGLLTVSRHGIREVRPLHVDAPAQELLVPLHPEDAGGVRLRIELSASSRAHGTLSGDVLLPVSVDARDLDVTVTPVREVVRPGDSVTLRVTVSDAAGAPAAGGEVALWLVDESVLALGGYRLGDPVAALHQWYRTPLPSLFLPHRVVLWERRPLGPGILSGAVIDVATGGPAGRLRVSVDGRDRGAVRDGRLLVPGLSPGPHRLVLSRDGGPLLERGVRIPGGGLDLGTILVGDPLGEGGPGRMGAGIRDSITLAATTFEQAESMAAMRVRGSSVDLEQDLPPPPEGKPVDVRDAFRALAAFEPAVALDGDGRARVTVGLPDTPTRYRIFAVASHGATRFGTAESAVTATRDLVVRASPPRVLRPGDEPELPVIVQNGSGQALDVEVAARAAGMSLTGPRGFRVRLPEGSRTEVRFPARTPRSAAAADLEVIAAAGSSPETADAVRVSLPVEPALAPRAVAYHRILARDEALRLPLEVPVRATPGYGAVDVGLSTTRLQPLVDVLRALCLQPLPWPSATSARVIGLAALDGALESLRAPDLPPPDELRRRLEEDVDRLRGWLAPLRRGGSGVAAEHGFVSSLGGIHAVHALHEAARAGYLDPGSVRASFAPYLRRVWEVERDRDLEGADAVPASGWSRATAAYALHVGLLVEAIEVGPRDVEWIEALEPADLPVEALAWLLRPAVTLPGVDPDVHAGFLRELESRALATPATVTFRQGERAGAESAGTDVRRLVLASDRRSDAVALAALLEDDPEHPLIPRLVRGLLGQRDGTLFGSAHENGWVLLALGSYAAVHETDPPDVRVRSFLDGEPLEPVSLGPDRPTAVRSARLPEPGGRTLLEVRPEGGGVLYVRAGVRYAPVVTRDMPAEERGFLVSRRYEAVDDSGDVRRDEDGTWRIRAGARVRVRLTFTAPARRYQVQLRDPLPGGLEVVNPRLRGSGFADRLPPPRTDVPRGRVSRPLAPTAFDGPFGWDLTDLIFRWRAWLGVWATHEELRDDGMEAYTPYLPAGTYESTFLVRATTPGTFLAPPPRVEEAEHPETFGQGTPDRVVVEAGG